MTAAPGDGRWEVRTREKPSHPCRHCGAPITPNETYFVEPSHPWILVHTECIQKIAWSLRKRVRQLSGTAQLKSDEEETVEALLGLRTFLAGIEQWSSDVHAERESLEKLLLQAFHIDVQADDAASNQPKGRRITRRGGADD